MPFRSPEHRRYMFARHPEIAKRWVRKYGAQIIKHNQQAKRRKRRG